MDYTSKDNLWTVFSRAFCHISVFIRLFDSSDADGKSETIKNSHWCCTIIAIYKFCRTSLIQTAWENIQWNKIKKVKQQIIFLHDKDKNWTYFLHRLSLLNDWTIESLFFINFINFTFLSELECFIAYSKIYMKLCVKHTVHFCYNMRILLRPVLSKYNKYIIHSLFVVLHDRFTYQMHSKMSSFICNHRAFSRI